MKQTLGLIIFLFLATSVSYAKPLSHPVVYGVISAMPSEGAPIQQAIQNKHHVLVDGIRFTLGTIKQRHVVAVISGMGMINASVATTIMIIKFHPKAVFLVGTAGSLQSRLHVGDVIIGERLYALEHIEPEYPVFNDELNPRTKKVDSLYVHANAKYLAIAKQLQAHLHLAKDNKLVFGLIATSNAFPQNSTQMQELKKVDADAIECEGFAVARVAELYHTPCLIVRGISDTAEMTLTKYGKKNAAIIPQAAVDLAEKNAATVVIDLINAYLVDNVKHP